MDHTRPAMEKGLLSKLVYPELTTTQKLSITGENFNFWKLKIPFLLADHEFHHLLEAPSSGIKTIPMSSLDNELAVKLICQTLDNPLSVRYEPYNRHKAKSMLNSLFTPSEEFTGKTSKIWEYKNYRMAANANINQHIFRMRAMAKELEVAGTKITDELQALMLLNSLPERWNWDVLGMLKDFDWDKEELSFFNVSQRLAIIRDEKKLKNLTVTFKGDNEEAAIPAGAGKTLTETIYPALKTIWKLTYAGSKFSIWKDKLGFVFSENGVDYVLKDPKPCEEDAEFYKKWEKDDFTCRHLMLGAMDDDLFLSFHDYPTAKTLMEVVEAWFNTTSSTRKLVLLERYLNHQMSHGTLSSSAEMSYRTPTARHLSKMDLKARKLEKSGITIPSEMQSVVLMNSVPILWREFLLSDGNSTLVGIPSTIDDARSRVREIGETIARANINQKCVICGKRDHVSSFCPRREGAWTLLAEMNRA